MLIEQKPGPVFKRDGLSGFMATRRFALCTNRAHLNLAGWIDTAVFRLFLHHTEPFNPCAVSLSHFSDKDRAPARQVCTVRERHTSARLNRDKCMHTQCISIGITY